MVRMRCQKQLCPYDTDQDIDATEAATTKIALLDLHDRQVHPPAPLQPQGAQPAAPQQNTQQVSPLRLILVEGQIEEAAWEAFAHTWANYKSAGNVGVGNKKALLANVLGETYTKVLGDSGLLHTRPSQNSPSWTRQRNVW